MRQSAATERENATRPATIQPPAFIGRERELAALTQALEGEPAVVLVEGEAGIGKTRLAKEFLASPDGQHLSPLVATCPPFRQPHTLGPVADAIRPAAAARVGGLMLSPLAGALLPLFPEWAADLPPALEPAEDPTAARHRVFSALAALLGALGVGLLVVEDLHWADEATLEFLLFLALQPRRSVSLLVTCRPEDVPEGSLLRQLSRHAAGSEGLRVTLRPLTVDQTAGLVSSMLAGEKVTDEFAAFMHERTEGLPLAVEESVRLMGDRADLAFRHGAWARRHLADIEVPPTVRDAVMERAARLGPEALAVLRAAALFGEPADEPVVTAVAGLEGESAHTGLAEALGCGLLVDDFFANGQSLVFRHALAARAVYDAIPARQRRDLHARAAQLLEGQRPLPVAQLARHFRAAGDAEEWCRYAEQAAGQALAVGDQATAAALLQGLVTEADLPILVVVRLARQIPLGALAEYASLANLIRRMRSLMNDDTLSPAERAEAGVQLGRLLINVDEYEAAAAELERAVPGLAHRPADAARAMILLGCPTRTPWPTAVHRRWVERGWAMAQDASIPDDERLVLAVNRATALLALGDEAGWAAVAELPAETSNPRQALQVAHTLTNAGEAAMRWGRYGDAMRRTRAALEIADQHDFPRVHAAALVQLACLDWLTGAWQGLAEHLETLTRHVEPREHLQALLTRGLLDAASGASAAAESKLSLVLEEARRRGAAELLLESVAGLAHLRLAEGEAGEALDLTDGPVEMITAKKIWIWSTEVVPVRVQALTAMGRTAEADALVRAFASGLHGRSLPAPKAALALCRAVLAAAAGEHRRAAAAFGRVAAAWQELPRPYDALQAREQQADCLLKAGQHDAALELLATIREKQLTLGATGDAGRVTDMLREHGVVIRRGWRGGRRGYGDQLSPRETEVVRLVAAGRTNREIAQELHRAPGTVYIQLRSAMRKFGSSSRTELALHAVKLVGSQASEARDAERSPGIG
jgi:DNA-binding CsgD family transcriptional regulator/tetratricopeptide (TPR) repeat protein